MKESPSGSVEQPDANDSLKSERIGRQLTEEQIELHLSRLPSWEIVADGTALRRAFELPGLRAALAFITYVVEIAEAIDHRPGIQLEDGTVTLTLTTHSVGGLTGRDFELAARIKT